MTTSDQIPAWLKWLIAAVLALPLLPFAFVLGIWHRIRGGADVGPGELAETLRGAADDIHPCWDDLECVNLKDAQLETIRQEALKVSLPLTPEGRSRLFDLAKEAEALG